LYRLKPGHRFVPGNAHDGQMINICPSHIGIGFMPEFMKPEFLNASRIHRIGCPFPKDTKELWREPTFCRLLKRSNNSIEKFKGIVRPSGGLGVFGL